MIFLFDGKLLKIPAAIRLQYFGHAFARHGFHQSVFAVSFAHGKYFDAAGYGGGAANAQANEGTCPADVERCKNDHQAKYQPREIPDVLRPKAAELDAFIDAFIDFINAVIHDIFTLYP